MRECIVTEFWKMKRYSVIKAGVAMMVLSVLMSFFYSTANTSVGWDFSYYIHEIIITNGTYFFPVIITLMAVFVISRENTDDTLKSVLTVPVSYDSLLAGKLVFLLFLTVMFSICNVFFAVIVNGFLGLPDMTVLTVAAAAGQILLSNVLIYISVLPLIILNTFLLKSSVFGAAIAFVYGYLGTFEGRIMNWYPVKAAMILTDPLCGSGYDLGDFTYQAAPAALVLGICFLLAILILAVFARRRRIPEKETESSKRKTAGKTARKKGW